MVEGLIWPSSRHLDALLLSAALERMVRLQLHAMGEKKLTQRALAALTKVTRAADWLAPELMREIKNTVRPYGLGHFFPLLRRMGFAPRHVAIEVKKRKNLIPNFTKDEAMSPGPKSEEEGRARAISYCSRRRSKPWLLDPRRIQIFPQRRLYPR
jgi:hypothetical protein